VAHLDTKAQGHSMAGRLVAIWAAVVAILALVAVAVTRLASARSPGTAVVVSVTILGLVAGGLAARGRLRGESAGARDNGTGVLAAMVAAGALKAPTVGLIVTGAEEFGLVGARALVREEPDLIRNADVINLDTLCDRGRLYVLAHLASGLPLARRIAAVVEPLGIPVEIRRLPLGILTDSLAFAPLTTAITLSRLDWSVLRVMHTAHDVFEGLDPGFAEALGHRLSDAYRFDTIPGPP
jgi:Zn-dependent M28 family amino/carboxypeptidase